ncbi:hypothetical protein [Pseudomonas cremoricolorata]|uniref:Uncharacterized protein n=1 Tax=Pseudomonas cremoricolorata TaxID=157783 RepID=A0A089WSL8_9PSED|nr:hypothetical protein [Pseudomonas cremoricolorata]AIR91601.1 hypothetical protein LK03_21095 [Pseudomonas cremoricolorata]
MTHSATPQQSGSIIISNPDGKFVSLNIPTDGWGKTYTLTVGSGGNKLDKPRKIQMDDLPSAATVVLTGKGGWSMTLKTTHQPAKLNSYDVHYFVNSYAKEDFIKEGLGLEVIDKQGSAQADSLDVVTVNVSPRGGTR